MSWNNSETDGKSERPSRLAGWRGSEGGRKERKRMTRRKEPTQLTWRLPPAQPHKESEHADSSTNRSSRAQRANQDPGFVVALSHTDGCQGAVPRSPCATEFERGSSLSLSAFCFACLALGWRAKKYLTRFKAAVEACARIAEEREACQCGRFGTSSARRV